MTTTKKNPCRVKGQECLLCKRTWPGEFDPEACQYHNMKPFDVACKAVIGPMVEEWDNEKKKYRSIKVDVDSIVSVLNLKKEK